MRITSEKLPPNQPWTQQRVNTAPTLDFARLCLVQKYEPFRDTQLSITVNENIRKIVYMLTLITL